MSSNLLKIVFMDKFGKCRTKEMPSIPPKGSYVYMGYKPLCEVENIIIGPGDLMEAEGTVNDNDANKLIASADVLINVN